MSVEWWVGCIIGSGVVIFLAAFGYLYEVTTIGPTPGWCTRLRIWQWKKLYAWRIEERAIGPEGDTLGRQFCVDSAQVGWEANLSNHDGDVGQALREDPVEAADEEMYNWVGDGETS